ncbi:MAG: mycofactocin biosynthesis glycosyltransferase MftF [Pseudonocardia sp.]
MSRMFARGSPVGGGCAVLGTTPIDRPSPGGSAPRAGAGTLPIGFVVRLDRRTRRLDGGAALLGGSPGRLLFLASAARRLFDDDAMTLVVRDRAGARFARRLLDAGVANPVAERLPSAPGAADVTVVVPVRDRPDGVRRLVATLAATAPGLAEVIVVDDGSRDELACRAAAGLDPARGGGDAAGPARGGADSAGPGAARVRVLRHPHSRGPAAARNTGLAAATTDLVAFLDSDVVPRPGWLQPLLAHLADPVVALAAPRITGLPHPRPGWLARYEGLRSSLDLGPDAGPVLPRSRVAYVPSAALLVRRAAVEAGFDERMPVAEDVDMGLRLHAAGWRLRYEPASRVAHEHRTAPLDWWTRKVFYGTGAAPLAVRHPGSVPPAVLAPWTVAALLLVATRRPGALSAAAGVTAFAASRLRRTLHRLPRAGPTAARLTAAGLLGAAAQGAGLLTRHWWPLTALACLVSRPARRVVATAALADGLRDWWAHRPEPGQPGLDPARYLLARRLDDLGYGAGLWLGAWRARSAAPLLPMITGRPAGRSTAPPPA